MTLARKRRWFQFTLRTLLVLVTVFCCWLGYELNWIRQRHAFYASHIGRIDRVSVPVGSYSPSGPAPGLLWLFGEVGWPAMRLYVETNDWRSLTESDKRMLRRAKQLFPEATNNEIWLIGNHSGGDWATTDKLINSSMQH